MCQYCHNLTNFKYYLANPHCFSSMFLCNCVCVHECGFINAHSNVFTMNFSILIFTTGTWLAFRKALIYFCMSSMEIQLFPHTVTNEPVSRMVFYRVLCNKGLVATFYPIVKAAKHGKQNQNIKSNLSWLNYMWQET